MEVDFYMNLVLDNAWENQALALPNPSVGALILDKNNAIISIQSHNLFGEAHAELLACKEAYKKLSYDKKIETLSNANDIYDFLIKNHNGIFKNASIFVTLEPCNHYGKTPPCANLIKELGFKKIFISSRDKNKIASGGIESLSKGDIQIESGILSKRGEDLLLPFLCMQEKGSFCVYKIAKRLNGSFEDGIISSIQSRIYSHKLRNIADRIIISTKTLINDNPILDSRLIKGRAPNICVIGKSKNIDKNLNIYSIKNRKISFYDNINDIPMEGFSIIEGGAGLFDSFRDKIDCMLVFISADMARGKNFYSEFKGRILHSKRIGEDILLWVKRD
ncbi:bifunctional diaminohydroxyphosphoribosylaminopyrimidine deaminase/5-amino-6-(5-phosphoribosylamino)uracil reductase RibD [Helicobacter sp. MIT 14-3879]|uniref:bifunctional diaminohydroxyphosphoribosylaminopyrimidine deaminase/5-amino-6-(5-phosphoribosylamino)uracil reductase RibD n=1 Tax=Helicobacter sp. MIT 14-3879 TaxID=2040649 RepID=UPI000E1EB807|nr:bifunctional diaminohydroxyphosphoribosylaminopyrimidine deaminase/5-amino-6-(5-phosphoribosylamino)uracil reductase RibD [Helicobacter sp. MIT 14-3879]RDU65612.1 bifunctional diaminohydroxyphosphoribosylaminopyrimidine deaminase/5-amino-6-(5-phosphoribosylamino)uracil reductase RibD [Helicobacter sp. MIT 14-3879]